MYCGNCGAQQERIGGQRFCGNCGAEAREATAVATVPQSLPYRAEPAHLVSAPQVAAITNLRLQTGAACPRCFSTLYFKQYTLWHVLIAIFLFPIGLLFFFAPIRVCENRHKYGLGKWLIGIIQVLLFIVVAYLLAVGYYLAK
jgi:hypothetical protein